MVSRAESNKENRSIDVGAPAKSEQAPRPSAPSNRRRHVFLILGIAGLIAAVCGVAIWFLLQGREETDDAYLDGHISNISSRIAGTVSTVLVNDNELVKQGQVLAKLDPTDLQVQVDQRTAALEEAQHQAEAARSKVDQSSLTSQGSTTQASADVSSTQAQLAWSRAAIKQAQADIRTAQMKVTEQEAQVRFAAADFDRYKAVYADRVVTKQQFDKSKEAYDIAEAQLQEAQQNLQSARDREGQSQAQLVEMLGRLKKSQGGVTTALATTRQKNIDEQQYESALAAVKRAEAQLKQAKLDLSYSTIVAPVSGRVGRKNCEVGQRIEQGQLLMAVVQDNPWITANYKETQVGKMRPGQPVEIKIDTFSGYTFKGRVDSVAPASGAKFSMLPPDNATGNFTKVVQRVPVKITLDEDSIKSIKDYLAPGMSCVVTVFTKH